MLTYFLFLIRLNKFLSYIHDVSYTEVKAKIMKNVKHEFNNTNICSKILQRLLQYLS